VNNTYQTVRTHLLYNDVIEHDGRLGTEPTVLGVILFGIAFIVLFGLFIFLGLFL
jgi:hypothetical protein